MAGAMAAAWADLGSAVLVLMFDATYMERFWPQLEAWLAFMHASEGGLVSTPEEQLRCTVGCLRDAPEWHAQALKDRWLADMMLPFEGVRADTGI